MVDYARAVVKVQICAACVTDHGVPGGRALQAYVEGLCDHCDAPGSVFCVRTDCDTCRAGKAARKAER